MFKVIYHPLASDEDAPPLARPGMLAVADGLGGRGAQTLALADGSKRSNAYHASRLCLDAIDQLYTPEYRQGVFEDLQKAEDLPAKERRLARLAQETGRAIKERMQRFMTEHSLTAQQGGGYYTLPTTLALILYRETESGVEAVSVWSGDSRCYAMDRDGLAQLSSDNLQGDPDYYSLLQSDTVMSTQINMTEPFQVSARYCALTKPCILFTASDGAFMYLFRTLPNPLALEYALLWKLNNPSFQEGADQLGVYLGKFLHDDLTIAMAALNGENEADLHRMIVSLGNGFIKRYAHSWPKPDQEAEAGQKEAALREAQAQRFQAYEKEVGAALPDLVAGEADILAQYPVSVAFENWKKQGDESAQSSKSALQLRLDEAAAAFSAALPDNWAELVEKLPPDLAKAMVPDPKSKPGQLMAELLKNRQKHERGAKWIQEARERNAAPYQRYMEALGNLGEVFSVDWEDKLPLMKSGLKHIDKNDVSIYVALNKMFLKAQHHLKLAKKIGEQTEKLKPHLGSLAPGLVTALNGLPDQGAALCGRIPGLAGLHEAMLSAREEINQAELQEKARQEGLAKTRAERLLQDPGALANWLMEQGYHSGAACDDYLAASAALKEHQEKFSVYGTQWQQYKPVYERLMGGPTGVSTPI